MRGADLLARSLAAAGVTRIFSLSGNQIMPVYDACIDAEIAITHVRHEGAAVFMADAWAQLTGGIGVALVTAAPGFANALGPLYTARGSEGPVLLLSGDAPVGHDGRGGFQELDQVAAARPLVKRAARAMSADKMGADVASIIKTALSGRPGPVHLALPFDVLQAETDAEPPAPTAFAPDVRPLADAKAIVDAIDGAARPVILFGPAMNRGRSGGAPDKVSAALHAPAYALESPRGLNDPSLGDLKGVLGQADLIVSIGKAIDFTLGFGGDAFDGDCRWIVIDPEESGLEQARRNLGNRLAIAALADPHPAAEALVAEAGAAPDRSAWLDEARKAVSARTAAAAVEGIGPEALASAVDDKIAASGETIVVMDGGEFGQWAQATIGHGGARIINGPGGSIGGGLCYAIAAKLAAPGATVFALMGDGTAGFHFAEFETAARENAPFVAVIGNDGRWNAEHQIQIRDYGEARTIGCELSDARYDLAAAGLGCHGEHVTDAKDIEAALDRAIASGKPACLDVEIMGLAAPSAPAH